jgi:hypothetical protein
MIQCNYKSMAGKIPYGREKYCPAKKPPRAGVADAHTHTRRVYLYKIFDKTNAPLNPEMAVGFAGLRLPV